jgi:hypothetical protein
MMPICEVLSSVAHAMLHHVIARLLLCLKQLFNETITVSGAV